MFHVTVIFDNGKREGERRQQDDEAARLPYPSRQEVTPTLERKPRTVALRFVISALCAAGAYASVFMLRKSIRAGRGELREFSVVMEPQARLYGGISNAAYGLAFYVAVLGGVWFLPVPAWALLEIAALGAAGTSVYLARSLARKRLACAFCWTCHAINWLLALLLPVAWYAFKLGK